MEQACIAGGLRSYIGVENGMYRNVSAEQLGAHVLRNVIHKYAVPIQDLDYIIAGNGVGGGGNLTRLMMLEAGLPEEIPAMTVDVQCGSGLEAIAAAAAKIESGLADVILAGGLESCSTKPLRIRNERHPDAGRDIETVAKWRSWESNIYHVAKFAPGKPDELVMLVGAEHVAKAWNMDRKRLDQYAMDSHRKAALAAKNGELQEILADPFSAFSGSRDEGIRENMSERLLERLPVLVPGGAYITAGNACLTHDGAAFVIVCSKEYAAAHGWKIEAQIMDVVSAGGSPERSPESILPAIDRLLQRNHFVPEQITAWEYNEAFSVIDVLMDSHFGESERYNIFGGALAYGHPYGASGGIITLHLLEALKKLECPAGEKEKYGIAAIAAAGGIGTAMLVRRR